MPTWYLVNYPPPSTSWWTNEYPTDSVITQKETPMFNQYHFDCHCKFIDRELSFAYGFIETRLAEPTKVILFGYPNQLASIAELDGKHGVNKTTLFYNNAPRYELGTLESLLEIAEFHQQVLSNLDQTTEYTYTSADGLSVTTTNPKFRYLPKANEAIVSIENEQGLVWSKVDGWHYAAYEALIRHFLTILYQCGSEIPASFIEEAYSSGKSVLEAVNLWDADLEPSLTIEANTGNCIKVAVHGFQFAKTLLIPNQPQKPEFCQVYMDDKANMPLNWKGSALRSLFNLSPCAWRAEFFPTSW